VHHVDVLVGNEEDVQRGLGIGAAAHAAASGVDPTTFFDIIDATVSAYPNIKVAATTLREVQSANRHIWGAVAWIEGQRIVAPTCQMDVFDRVGGGDGFASGLFFGLLTGRSPEEAVRLGWAHGALLTTFPGDTSMATREQVEALADGASARIER